jgi:MscS family membrane protein
MPRHSGGLHHPKVQGMDMSFWEQTFYSNTIKQWSLALLIAFGVWLGSRILYWISANVLKSITERTKNRLDDILLRTLQQPVILLLTLMGLLVAYHQLEVPERLHLWMQAAYHAAVTISVTWLLARVVDAMITEYLLPYAQRNDTRIDDHLVPMARRGLGVMIWVIGIIVALDNAGYNVGALLAGLGIGGLALAMAAKDTVANIFGGITVLTDKPFLVGDRIRINGYDGIVLEVGIRSTRIRTLEGPVLVIPNFKFTDSMLENVSEEQSRRVRHELGLVYETPPEKVNEAVALLNKLVDDHQDILTPERLASFIAFKDFSLNILFIYYIRKEADIFAAQTLIHTELLARFHAAGLSFAYPTSVELQKEFNPS